MGKVRCQECRSSVDSDEIDPRLKAFGQNVCPKCVRKIEKKLGLKYGVEIPDTEDVGGIEIPATEDVIGVPLPATTELYGVTKKWAPKKIKEGGLGGWSKDLSAEKRHKILERVKSKSGYATVIRRLNFLNNISDDPATKRAAKSDMTFMQKKYRYGAYLTHSYAPYITIGILFGIAYYLKRKR